MDKIIIRETNTGFQVEGVGLFQSLKEAIAVTSGFYVFIPYNPPYGKYYG